MKIISAELIGWRNYESETVTFDGSPTIFVGSNGQGKTNFVEALIYAASGRSHRTSSDAVLVRQGSAEAIIRISVGFGDRRLAVDLKVTESGSNTARVNGTVTPRRELSALLPLVVFAPEDMDLVRGEPEFRRVFLADIVTESSTTAAADLADYDRVLKQRNTLLKSLRNAARGENSTLDSWTDGLVTLAAKIMRARRVAVRELSPKAGHHYRSIASTDDVMQLSLSESLPDNVGDFEIERALAQLFHAKRVDEIDRGSTLIGPHRDDMVITLNGLPARSHSSQGEAWSVALALRLAQLDIVSAQSRAGDPVVILDDVFSELDVSRRNRLGTHLHGIEHVIITAADLGTIPESLSGRFHTVKGGAIDG